MNELSGFGFLIVEDDTMQAHAMRDMLESLGGHVSTMAFTYEQAQNAISTASFDCAILDLNLGGTLAFPVADVLRQRGTPFVVCTGYAEAVDVHPTAAEAPRLSKPIQDDELLAAVLQALQAKR